MHKAPPVAMRGLAHVLLVVGADEELERRHERRVQQEALDRPVRVCFIAYKVAYRKGKGGWEMSVRSK